ncbi:hypothetical protein EUTSA_v10028206mg [Eutrema salsugineum]|uniref:F-box domain-containing protein n=1 Tax=Eutrema salsugineum TaxID=72664 RepID=V4L964_EUTSA|nr:hypothetical protein EUTSA_v10028206mg [Eutrema salsugineum]
MSSPSRSSGEEPLTKKTKRTTPSPELSHTRRRRQSSPIPSLPNDLLLSCFARISRLYYPTLSLVSKSFRCLLSSPEFHQTRSLSGRTESCLYVCLLDSNPRWFTLFQKPKRNKEKNSSGKLLAPIPIPKSPEVQWQCVVSIGSNIYAIGGQVRGFPSSDIWVLDCHCHAWRKAPSMRVERDSPAANVFDGKIYIFDPKTQTWEPVMCPLADKCISSICRSAVIEGGVAYKPKEDKWEVIGGVSLVLGWDHYYCVIDNVLYCLRGRLEFPSYGCVKLADYGGKLAVLWTQFFRSGGCNKKRIWCAVIVLERRSSEEIWGTVEWHDHVLTVPNSYRLEFGLAATV